MQASGRRGGCLRFPGQFRCAALLTFVAVAPAVPAVPAMAAGPIRHFNLPAERFPQAILDFYRQSGVQAIYAATPRVERLRTHAVNGVLASSEALARMLAGSGLGFVFDGAHAVLIRPLDRPPPAQRLLPAAPSPPAPPALVPAVLQHDRARLRQVNVTGSLIPGVQEVIAPVVYLKRRALSEASYATVQDSLYALPFVSLNGPREDLGINNNYEYGAAIDLRGLGVGATLVLVNGQRQPLSGLTGDFVDVSTIPWSAVKRIEVLPDGASALYGSDAIAGVVNIIMRDGFEGAETQARVGTAIGGRRETMASQLLGAGWASGHAMLAYQFSDDTPLAAAERPYAADADKVPYGGANYDSYYSNPGNILDPATLQPLYGIPAGQNGTALTAPQLSPRINLENQFAGDQLFPEAEAHEFYAAASQDIGADVELFAQGRFTHRDTLSSNLPEQQVLTVPASNPFYVNPLAGTPYTLVAYSFSKDLGPSRFASRTQIYLATLGARIRWNTSWQASLSESYGRQALLSNEYHVVNADALAAALADPNPATAFDPFGDGSFTQPATLTAVAADFPLHSSTGIESTRLIAGGSLLALPAGEAKLAVGVERREDSLAHEVTTDPFNPNAPVAAQRYGRHILAAFTQLDLPLIARPIDPRGPPLLAASLAGRYERYSDFGNTFNPSVRVRWMPSRSLKVRASWGRSFRAPKLDDLYDTSQNAADLIVLPDPEAPTGRSLVLVEQGSNPALEQESATTWTAGVDLAPSLPRRSTLSLTYYSIDYRNRIELPAYGDPFDILVQQSEWQAVITRHPSPARVAAICEAPDYIGNVAACLASSPAALIDGRLANLASTTTRGVDFEAHQGIESGAGAFGFDLRGTYVFSFEQAVTDSSAPVGILDTVGNPLALKLRATAQWSQRGPERPGLGLEMAVNHLGAYRNPGSALRSGVSAWTTLDLQIVYRMRRDDGGSSGMELLLNATNVLNSDPPFVDNPFGYDRYNVQPLGRVLSVDLTKRW